ncbi:MAG: GntR family transcriptional regulator, partial [Candidatus Neomarinimicrobiota bacterium]
LPNDKIPSENELATAFSISRMTVRQAIRELVKEGYIHIKRGEGTFVREIPATQMLIKLEGFSAVMHKMGYHTHSQILRIQKIIPSMEKYEYAYRGLNELPEQPLVMVRRLRYLEETPYCLETSFLTHAVGEGLLEKGFDENISIYGFIEHERKIHLSRAEHIIEPALCKGSTAELLKIKQGSPILFIRGTTYSMDNRPIEYLEGIYRGDKYKLSVEIKQ